MFAISTDGQIFHDGVAVGFLTLDSDRTSASGQRQIEITAHGRVVEQTERDGDMFGEMVFSARIKAAGARTFLQKPSKEILPG